MRHFKINTILVTLRGLQGRTGRGLFGLLLIFFLFFTNSYSNYPNFLSDSIITGKSRFPDWKVFAGMAGAVGATLVIDKNISTFMYDNQKNFWKKFCKISDLGGEKNVIVPALLITYGTSFLIKSEKLQLTAEASIKSAITSFIFTETFKQVFGRARPYMDMGAFHSRPFPILDDKFKSMPSGHTSVAFAIFTPFAENYTRWFYCIPVAVAFGRVYQNRHWVSDVIAGGSIGFLSGYFFVHGRRQIEIIPNGFRIYF